MVAVGFLKVSFTRVRKFSFIPGFLSVFVVNGCSISSNIFSVFIKMIIHFFLLFC